MERRETLALNDKLIQLLIISIFLYVCESCVLTAELERRIQDLEIWCQIGEVWIAPKKTMWRMGSKFTTRSGMQLECITIFSSWWRCGTLEGMVTSQDPLVYLGWFCRKPWKGQEENEGRGSNEKTTRRNWHILGLIIRSRQRKTGQCRKNCCNIIKGAPTTIKVKGLNWTYCKTLSNAI